MEEAIGEVAGQYELREPSKVMRLARMGAFHQSRLSFMRVLLRRLKNENWQFDRPRFDIDEKGVGTACYRAKGPERSYTLVAFSHDLPDEKRSDRVIADAWDSTFALVDGEASEDDIRRLSQNVPLQEAGRISNREMTLSRANKSVRMFEYIKDCLAKGEQPDVSKILSVGYLMRTTAVYGSGKFGAADRDEWADRAEFSGSFQPELLTVWLIRAFTIDLVEHLAKAQSPDSAVKLDPAIKRRIGVGNSTGLGMAPFLMNHPRLIHSWINARETALARVRSLPAADVDRQRKFRELVKRAVLNADSWHSEHELQTKRITGLKESLAKFCDYLNGDVFARPNPWNAIHEWAENNLCLEGQEQVVSLMIEPHGDLVDDLAPMMSADESCLFPINGRLSVSGMRALVEQNYPWVLNTDFEAATSIARIWYVSEEKLEPRLGERFEEDLDPYEQPLCPGRDISRLYRDLARFDGDEPLAAFLLEYPAHRHAVRRVQLTATIPYGEIHDNTICSQMMPIDLLRCKLSFFGATKFDPRSDRWVRITMYQEAPYPDELSQLDPDELAYPPLEVQ